MRLRVLLALVCLAPPLTGLAGKESDRLRVATLHTVLTEIAREIGGDEIDTIPLMPPASDPHVFDPSPADLLKLRRAELVLASGLGLEPYLSRLKTEIGAGRVVEVGNRLPEALKLRGVGSAAHAHPPNDPGHTHEQATREAKPGSDEDVDPHWWHGIGPMLAAVDIVEQELSARRPAFKSAFARNASAYRAQLRALQSWTVSELSPLPAAQRHLITTHDAFGYFAREHGFTVHPMLGRTTAEEADARQVAAVVNTLRSLKIKAVFAERSANTRLVEAVLRETGARLGGSLFADGLGSTASAASYESMMRHNVETIAAALR